MASTTLEAYAPPLGLEILAMSGFPRCRGWGGGAASEVGKVENKQSQNSRQENFM